MTESSVVADSDVILPYRFEPDSLWSNSEESESNDTDSQASFTERLGNPSWCSCMKCLLISVSTLSPLTVCLVTSTVYITSLSRQSVLNVYKHVTHLSLPSKHSSTSDNLLQQMHSTARGICSR